MGRYRKTYYSMYSKDGFGVYSSKYRMDDAADYTIPIETGEFQSKDEAFWFAQDGFDGLCLGVSSEELRRRNKLSGYRETSEDRKQRPQIESAGGGYERT